MTFKLDMLSWAELYLYEGLEVIWAHAREVQQEVPACVLQMIVLSLLSWSL